MPKKLFVPRAKKSKPTKAKPSSSLRETIAKARRDKIENKGNSELIVSNERVKTPTVGTPANKRLTLISSNENNRRASSQSSRESTRVSGSQVYISLVLMICI